MKKLVLIVVILVLALIPTAQAGKGNNTLGIVEVAPYSFGQTIHPFTDTPSYADRGPYYSLFCYQPDPLTQQPTTVYGISQYLVYPRDGSTVAFLLSGQGWTSGAADCDLSVWHVNSGFKNRTTDATFSFHVNG